MQDDVVSTGSPGFGVGETPLHDEFREDRGFSSYARGMYSGLGRGSRRATTYLSGHNQQQPLVMGAAAAAAVGAAAGVLLARSQIRRRRKTDAERIADALSAIPTIVSSRIPSVDVEEIRHLGGAIVEAALHRGSEALEATRGMGATMSEKLPEMSQKTRMAGITGDLRQRVRGGVGLVPIAVSLMRNPLVRDMIARAVTRRASRRRRIGM